MTVSDSLGDFRGRENEPGQVPGFLLPVVWPTQNRKVERFRLGLVKAH